MTDNELVAPRPLTKSDASHLRTMIELQLHITDEAAGEDAADLIEYALDMIERGKNVGSVMEELEFMQYEVCNAIAAQKIGKCLTSFLREITREMEGKPNSLDLSTKAASRKPSREMHEVLLSGSVSAAQRSKQGIYNKRGELVKQWAGVKGNEEIDVDARRRQYYKDLEEETIRKQLVAEGKLDPCTNRTNTAASGGGESLLNLSALASAHRPYGEIEALHTTADERRGLKKQIYDESGQLNAWNNQTKNNSSGGEMDLSTMGNLKKKAAELDALRATGGQRRGVKGRIYDESGQLNAWNGLNNHTEDGGDADEDGDVNPQEKADDGIVSTNSPPTPDRNNAALGEQRRKEFEAVMRDRSLGREEKSRRIAEIKQKYASVQSNSCAPGDAILRQEGNNGELKLGADSAAKKHHSELEFLRSRMRRGSVDTGSQQRNAMYNEKGEIVCDSANKNNEGEQRSHNPDMDLSTMGSIKKKSQELDAIRASADKRRGVKNRIYDSSGRLNAWTSLEVDNSERSAELLENDDQIASSSSCNNNNNNNVLPAQYSQGQDMDLSAQGYTRKKSQELDAIRASAMQRRGVKNRIYDASGRLNAWTSLEDKEKRCAEQNNEQCIMDLSAEGMKLKKAREIESLRAGGNERTAKQQMYDADGKIIGASNNCGEQDNRHNPSIMDLSAEGMRRKKAREINALRATANPHVLKQKMYDADGNLVGCTNNDGEQDRRHNPDMDLSAEGMRLKKAREMEALRETGRRYREGAKKSMYNESGELNAWNNLKDEEDDGDDGGEDRSSGLPSNMDLTADGMKRKKAREIELLRSSLRSSGSGSGIKTQMYDADGRIIGVTNNDGEQDRHNQSMDLSAEGMKLKKARELEAIRTGAVAIDHKATVPPRKLTEEEASELRRMLKSELKIPNDSYEGDASDLLDYAFDMIGDKKAVGDVMEELVFMEMKVLDAGLAENFGQCLSTFLLGLTGESTASHRAKAMAIYDVSGNIIEKKKEASNSKIDLSAKAAAQRQAKEMQATLLSGTTSAKERSKQGIYDENGVLVKQWDAGSDEDEPAVHGINLSAQAAAKRASQEVDHLLDNMENKKAGGGLGDRMSKYNGFVAPRGDYHHEGDDHDEARMQALDLSAKAFSRKPSREVGATLSRGAGSAKERNKKEIYDENGVLVKQWARVNEEDEYAMQDSIDAQRREELHSIKYNGSLTKEEKAEMIEEVKARYAAASASIKGGGNIARTDDNAVIVPENKSLDEQRKKEFSAIMRDRTLSREERAKRVEEMKKKYTSPSTQNQMKERIDSSERSNEEGLGLDLSALAFARKSSQEMRATLLNTETSAKERNKQHIYDSNGVLIKQWANVKEEENDFGEQEQHKRVGVSFKEFISKSVDEQRRDELRSIMRDRSLSKSERAMRIGEVKARYAAAAAGNHAITHSHTHANVSPTKQISSNRHGQSAAIDDQRRRELQYIMKDRGLDREEKNRLMEEIKLKYDSMEPTDDAEDGTQKDCDMIEVNQEKDENGVPEKSDSVEVNQEERNDTPIDIDLSAASFSQKHLQELEAIKAKAAEGKSLKDRMAAFNNDTTVYYDSVSFAVSQNNSESARQMAKRETFESAKKYNYNYGDGGVVEETSAEFKANGDSDKAAKKEAKESAKGYNHKLAPTINCDPLSFAVKNNKSEAARKSVKRDTKESAKYYNYHYTG